MEVVLPLQPFFWLLPQLRAKLVSQQTFFNLLRLFHLKTHDTFINLKD
jgi:hypothetical protein